MIHKKISESANSGNMMIGKKISNLNKKNHEDFFKSTHYNNRHNSTGEIIEKFSNGHSKIKNMDPKHILEKNKNNLDENNSQKIKNELSIVMGKSSLSKDLGDLKNFNDLSSDKKSIPKKQNGSFHSADITSRSFSNQYKSQNINSNMLPLEIYPNSTNETSFNLKDIKESLNKKLEQKISYANIDHKKFNSEPKSDEKDNQQFTPQKKDENISSISKNGLSNTNSSPIFDITYIESGIEQPINIESEKISTFRSTLIHLYDLNHTRFIEGKIKGSERGKFIIHTREFGKIQLNFRNKESTLFINIFSESKLSERNIKNQLSEIKERIMKISPSLKDVKFKFNSFNMNIDGIKSDIHSSLQNKTTRFTINENHKLNKLV